MKTLKQIAGILAAAITGAILMNASAFAGAGAHAGDGVYVNGQLKMRDFIETNKANGGATRVVDNKRYLERLPGFMPIFKQIAAADPVFAYEIWDQLNEARIWLIPSKLPLLPFAETTLVGPRPQVQIAIHSGNEIMISTIAMAQLPPKERPFELIHEALHGLIPGNGAIHEMRVMYMTKWLHDHQGHFTTTQLDDELDRIGVKHSTLATEDAQIWHVHDFNRVLTIYLAQKGTPQSLCQLKAALETTMGNSALYIATNYDPNNCSAFNYFKPNPTVAIDAVKSFSPILGQLLNVTTPNPANDVFDGEVMTGNIDIEDLTQWPLSKSSCHQYANPALSGTIESKVLEYQSSANLAKLGESEVTRLHEMLDSDYTQDPAEVAAVYLYITSPPVSLDSIQWGNLASIGHLNNYISQTKKMIAGPLATAQLYLNKNIQLCVQKYGSY